MKERQNVETVKLIHPVTIYDRLRLLSFISVPSRPDHGLRFEVGSFSARIPFSGGIAALINLAENNFGLKLRQR